MAVQHGPSQTTLGRDVQELTQLTQAVTAATSVALDDAQVFQALACEFARSDKYAASVFLLTTDASRLVLAATSHHPSRLQELEHFVPAEGIRPQGFCIDLVRSRTCNAVARHGQTLRVRVDHLLGELFPSRPPPAVSQDLGYWQRDAVLTPLYRRGRIIGLFAMSSAELPADSITLVSGIALYISCILEVAGARAGWRRGEEALRRSEEKYRTLFERVPIGLYRTTTDGGILDANPALVQMLGYPDKQSLLAVNVLDIFGDPQQRRAERALVERDEIVRGYEVRLRRRDGSEIWAADTVRAIRDASGHVAWYEGSIEDITARRESAERFRQMTEVIPVAFWMLSPDFERVLYASPATEHIFGRPCEDFCRQPLLWLETVHPDDRERVHVFWTEHAGEPVELQHRIVRPDGQVRWVKDVNRPVRDRETGALLMLTGYVEDVTELVHATEALRSSERTLRLLLDAVYESVALADREGTVLAANKAFAERLGMEPSAVIGLKPLELWPSGLAEHRMAVLSEVIRTRRPVRTEDERYGRRFDWVVYPMLDALGNVEHVALYARDVTEQRRAEAQLAQSTRLASLGTLAGGIAHELRNPLAVISAGAQLLDEHLDDPVVCHQCVGMIRAATERASETIESVLKLAGGLDAAKTAVDVNLALLRSTALLQSRMALQDIKLRRRRQPGLPKAYGNAHLLQLAFFNLISNACNAMPHGGTLTITTRVAEPGWIIVRFRDTGHGIAPEILPRIFDPFFSTMPVGEGSGLGLPVSHRIIEQHGGSIEVRSQVGKGAAFAVRLPAASRDSAPSLPLWTDATDARGAVEST